MELTLLRAGERASPLVTLSAVQRLLASLDGLSPAWPLGLATVAVWLFWAPHEGGFTELGWSLLGLGLTLLLALGVLIAGRRAAPVDRLGAVSLVSLGAFVAWNYLSIIWADFRGDALVGADKALVYAVTFSIFALWQWSSRGMAALLALFSVGITVLGAVVFIRTTAAVDPGVHFADGRLVPPVGYINANTALWMLAFWPAVYLGSTRALPIVLRPLFLAGGTLLLELSVLGESRAWLLVLPAVAVLFVLLARERLRCLLGLAVTGGGALIALRPLVDVYDRASGGQRINATLDRAGGTVLFTCLLAGALGAVWAALDARVTLRRRTVRALGAATLVAILVATAAAVAVAARRVDDPSAWASTRWHDFTCLSCESGAGSSRLTGGLAANRYREWKVAWDEFVRHPVTGIGSDNYAAAYLLHRPNPLFQPQYPHSTPMRLLSQLGIVGTGLFALAVAAAVLGALRERARRDVVGGGAVAAALSVFAVWLLHGSADWFWEIPALAGPAFGALGLASAAAPEAEVPVGAAAGAPRAVHVRLAAGGLAALVLVAASVALLLPWLSARYESAGADVWADRPAQAYDDLERAADFNPLSAEPLLVEGTIALRRADDARARSAFRRALRREPKNWFGHFQLALLEGSLGNYRAASISVRRARLLNPQDPVAAILDRLVRRRVKIDSRALDDLYVRDVERRLRGTGGSLSATSDRTPLYAQGIFGYN